MLRVENLNAWYDRSHVLQGVSLEVNKGEIITLMGRNGAGKTTLLRTISGLNKPTSGVIHWMGESVNGVKAEKLVRRGISHVSEGKSVVPELSVRENLLLGAIWRRDKKEAKRSLDEVTSIFPRLGERIEQRSDTLSGGERQMLAIGRAIMAKPKLLLLDEPSAGLSPVRQDEAFLRVSEINKAGVTCIMVEQNARRCLQISDRAYVLDQGKDAVVGTGRELLNDPQVIGLYLGTLGA